MNELSKNQCEDLKICLSQILETLYKNRIDISPNVVTERMAEMMREIADNADGLRDCPFHE